MLKTSQRYEKLENSVKYYNNLDLAIKYELNCNMDIAKLTTFVS